MIKVAIAGQPNCGKSTIFTMMSGVKQYVANYPGVTVEKKSTVLRHAGQTIELVDLPRAPIPLAPSLLKSRRLLAISLMKILTSLSMWLMRRVFSVVYI
ncbi:FeoB small GTPase domain-containing protein [Oligella urethralis]|uniref:FeoB small GTPase domain-containing protein n=1 Tax=Oligella urethralis TaxID=90245 RepID=UPI0027BAA9BB|nr:FeoB small GTPase domain-containing protein [Oligella urethralis]